MIAGAAQAVFVWLKGLPVLGKIGLGAAVVFAAGTAVSSPSAAPPPAPTAVVQQAQPSVRTPVVTIKTVRVEKVLAFKTSTVVDPSLDEGKTLVRTAGVTGKRVITYRVTLTDGVQTGRVKVSDDVAVAPVDKVLVMGTHVYVAPKPKPAPLVAQSNCDSNYTGACVPIASDVDCAGGSGNGPAYVQGPVTVVGTDVYGLDRDGNGVGCE